MVPSIRHYPYPSFLLIVPKTREDSGVERDETEQGLEALILVL
jgi:hypothetical protein